MIKKIANIRNEGQLLSHCRKNYFKGNVNTCMPRNQKI